MTDDDAHIEPVLQVANGGRVDIDNSDLVRLFPGKLVSNVRAYLTGSEDKNVHRLRI